MAPPPSGQPAEWAARSVRLIRPETAVISAPIIITAVALSLPIAAVVLASAHSGSEDLRGP